MSGLSDDGKITLSAYWQEEAKKNKIDLSTVRSSCLPVGTRRNQIRKPAKKKPTYSVDEILAIAKLNGESYGVTVAKLDGYLKTS